MHGPGQKKESEDNPMTPDKEENLDELMQWYAGLYTRQLIDEAENREVTGTRMRERLASLQDGISSYRQWREQSKPPRALPFERPAAIQKFYERATELERTDPINIDARHATFNQNNRPQEKKKYARCGNCGQRYEIGDDAADNHHRAMIHKTECSKGNPVSVNLQRRHFMEDFQEQPMQIALRDRAAAEIERGADPARLMLTGVDILTPLDQTNAPARWWKVLQFWKW